MNNTLTPADLPSLCIITAGLLASGHFSSRKNFQGPHGELDETAPAEGSPRYQVVPAALGLLSELKQGLFRFPGGSESETPAFSSEQAASRREAQLGLLAMFGDDEIRAAVEAGTMTLDAAEAKIRAERRPRFPLTGGRLRDAIAENPEAHRTGADHEEVQAVS